MRDASLRCLRPMMASDLEIVLAWRNHPEVRRYMYTQHEITIDEHNRWFAQAVKNPQWHLLIFEPDAIPLGFINIHQTGPGGIAEWGFYAAPDAPKGTGRSLGHAALRYAFVEAGLYKLCGQALAFNERSIRFHRTLGFKQEGILRQQHYDGEHYHDVLYFGLHVHEWQAQH
jgi:UDP-4-amino-4,6-dideoxy-N-acetyl-beta-L-altrosamine N-acetyltransferase